MLDLRLGDCLDILPTLAAASFDAIITDLPYGTTACSWDIVIPFAPMWEQVKRLLKPRGAFVTTASQPFTSALVMSNLAWFKYAWVWIKNSPSGHLNAWHRPMMAAEDILVFCDGKTIYNPQRVPSNIRDRETGGPNGKIRDRGLNETSPYKPHGTAHVGETSILKPLVSPRNVLEFDVVPRSTGTDHPTQKPVALYAYLIRTYTNPGDVVLDFVMGSGTTGVAAWQEGRSFVGIEKREDYFAIAQRRIGDAQPPLMVT